MTTDDYVLAKNACNRMITELLIKKYGEEALIKLLLGECDISPARKLSGAYVRYLKDSIDIFEDTTPDSVLTALADAKEEMSYSNWTTDKFDRASEIIIRYCLDHDIPIEFREDLERSK